MNVRHWLLAAACLAYCSVCCQPAAAQRHAEVGGSPFGWNAGDKFDGCGYGGCGPGCDCPDCASEGWSQILGGHEATSVEGCGCGSMMEGCTQCFLGCSRWSAGVELTFLKPHFDGNPAFTTLNSNGTTQDSFSETEFDFDAEAAPRVWIELLRSDELGFQFRYWQLEDNASTAMGSPPDNGFGRISTPAFGAIELSSTIPGSNLTANSELNAYSLDLEATHA
ncbi:MAG: hypothetical protein AAGF97_05155, partial [Planctomycetota bacterium]